MIIRPDVFEAIMLICFGCAWPLSIYKTWKTKTSRGKSPWFLLVILIGYISGILFEVTGELNKVIYLYLLNTAMVFADLLLSLKYRHA